MIWYGRELKLTSWLRCRNRRNGRYRQMLSQRIYILLPFLLDQLYYYYTIYKEAIPYLYIYSIQGTSRFEVNKHVPQLVGSLAAF